MLDILQVCPELKCLGGLAENQHTRELEKPHPQQTGESKVRGVVFPGLAIQRGRCSLGL